MKRSIAWRCLNPDCGHAFYAPDVSDTKPPHWQWCPECRASSRRKSEIERAEAAAALAAKDAEIERLRTALGSLNATLMGMQDGSLVRDQAAEIERLRADHEASVDELFGSLGVATAALTAIHTALGCGPHLNDALGAVAALRARLAKAEAKGGE